MSGGIAATPASNLPSLDSLAPPLKSLTF